MIRPAGRRAGSSRATAGSGRALAGRRHARGGRMARGTAIVLAAALLLAQAPAPDVAHAGTAVARAAAKRAPARERKLPVRFLALGDSYTIGQGVAESERWPVQLAARLKPRHPRLDAPEIVARTGWTTDELSEAIDRAAPRGPYDLVSLLIGVNDQYRGRGSETFREPFRALLTRAITFAGGEPRRVLVLSIPDWGVTPFAGDRDRAKIAREIDAFNAAAREETQRTGARWIDVTGVSREAAGEPSLLAGDGLHPSGIQYARWAELALPAAIELLSARKADGAPGR